MTASPALTIMFFQIGAAAGDHAYASLFQRVEHAERAGFTAVWIPERHFSPLGSLFPSPELVLAALSQRLRRMHLRAGSVIAPLRHPVALAESWAMLDTLAPGRCGLSLASGWSPHELEVFGAAGLDRKARLRATASELRALWRSRSTATPNGALELHPRAPSDELPIWITVDNDVEMARWAGENGFRMLTSTLSSTLEQKADLLAVYRAACTRSRPWVTLMTHACVADPADPAVVAALRDYVRTHMRSLLTLGRGPAELDASDVEELIDEKVDFILHGPSLVGSEASVHTRLRAIAELAVDEVACLLDAVPSDSIAATTIDRLAAIHASMNPTTIDRPATIHSSMKDAR
jgi:natural product biosynthesis luciferase-like monooxygenase protein